MRKFIFTERNGIHIIDLAQTVDCLEDAAEFARDLVANDEIGDDAFHRIEEELDWLEMAAGKKAE